ncbi:MAG TPA: DUF3105 domain-containing protein [Solirubrobacteraceae bacterium]|nr:DUF3105 domain-containing protein [Solirubrobacteraceae bacterium]
MRLLERLAIILASLALAFGLIALLSGFFQSRDNASLAGSAGLGQRFRDMGNGTLAPGTLRPPYDSDPPTSGPHLPAPVTHDRVQLNDDQLLTALSLGNVVIMYGTRQPPPDLVSLASSLAGTFTPSLAAAGQAVILSPRPGLQGYLGVAWTHLIRVGDPGDPHLRSFAAYWLGRGAPR